MPTIMKHLVSLYFSFLILFAAMFFAPAFALAAASTTPFDLNGNSILDADEAEVVVEADAVLPAGEYHFNALTITNNATLTAQGDPNSPATFKGVKISATSLTVTPGSSLNADGTGYGSGFGPGAPTVWYAGASYGGVGIGNISTSTYGSATQPTDLGSGNGSCSPLCGGGALRLVISGTLMNNGTISANGGGSSSGGSLYITAGTLTGNGMFSSNGGNNTLVGCCYAAAGGGGRIAIYYGNSAFTGTTEALGGKSQSCYYCGASYAENGTIGFFDTSNNNLIADSLWRFQANDSPFNFNKIILKNGSRTAAESGASITANELLVDEGSLLTLSGEETLTLNKITITGNSNVTIASEKTLSLTIPNLTITSGSSLNTDGKGFGTGFGPGAPANQYYGASYGGVGIGNTASSTYGSATTPTDFGSGSGACTPPSLCGGGALRLIVTDTLANDGIVSSNGGGSSSGGSVYVTANAITGLGVFSANGGDGSWLGCCYASAGGGGRVAVYYKSSTFTGTSTALGGKSQSAYYNPASYAGNGTVVFEEEGTPEPPVAECCSSVAFLPGLEASRLYRNLPLAGETRLWEPPIIHNNSQLFLNPDGTPKTAGIYTKDVLDEAYGFNIYKSFMASMDSMVTNHTIHEWKPLPYDWRFDVDDIVKNPVLLANGSYSMIDEMVRLASSSPTKKVTIIAHSNGGLVGKELISKLTELGKGDIVDKFIMVAVPQVGTPEAVGALLNGFDQNHFPLINTETARTLAENMPSAYNLLPSESYFIGTGSEVKTPVVKFAPGSQTAMFTNMYGNEIGNFNALQSFLRGSEGRTKPESGNVIYPNVLNSDLLSAAHNRHNTLDSWTPPTGVKVYQIAGWGVDTLTTIKYKQGSFFHCLGLSPCIDYDVSLAKDGDGTVVVPSALAMITSPTGVSRYWMNMSEYNDSHIDREHKDILEVSNLRDFLGDLITNTEKPLIDYTYLSASTPPSASDKKLRYFLHSPLSLDLYDNVGNHTGISTTTGVLENQIPGAYYREFGEVKYITAPASTMLHLAMNGQSSGYFTLDIQEAAGDTITATTTFADIPTATSTRVAMDFTDGTIVHASSLRVDQNGDGITDVSLAPKLGEIVTLPPPKPPFTYRFDGFLQPINDTNYNPEQAPSVFKGGSTVPVKFQLKKADGLLMQATTSPLWLAPQKGGAMSAAIDETTYSDPASSGSTFKWDSTSQQYIYNWSTKGVTPGYWYRVSAKLDDGKTYSVTVGLR